MVSMYVIACYHDTIYVDISRVLGSLVEYIVNITVADRDFVNPTFGKHPTTYSSIDFPSAALHGTVSVRAKNPHAISKPL